MKNVILAAAILLSASTGWSAWGNLSCTNSKSETLEIKEVFPDSKFPGKISQTDIAATLTSEGKEESFQGTTWNLVYLMLPTEDGQDVNLQIVPKKSFANNCGRCPGGDFPKPVPTYYAKLTVGNQIYDFVCY